MRRLTVALGSRSYPICIGAGVISDTAVLAEVVRAKKVAIVSNTTVAPLYLADLEASLQRLNISALRIILPDGEEYKNWNTLNTIFDQLLSARCDRKTPVIALGGGVVGDMAGFAAATYQRGVPFIQIPTTLLAQVDSSVGGKTGINHPLGKNMIGAFWQPGAVLIDTETLKTLPEREFSAGMAEVIKYGLIRDLPFFEWIETNIEALNARDSVALTYAIERSCKNKAEVVGDDELETAKEGGRALLNLGHTFGHAIETGLGYGKWLHGEAVAAGIVMAVELSRALGFIANEDKQRVINLLDRARLPIKGPALGANRYLELMAHDKKVLSGQLRLVLLRQLGQATTSSEVDESLVRTAIEVCCNG